MEQQAHRNPQAEPDRREAWVRWLLVGLVFLIGFPPLVELPGTGLDPSWKLGLHLARERGFTVGRDLFFTYGPWGFLAVPLALVRTQWLAAIAFQLGAHLALFAGLGVWMRRHARGWRAVIALLPLLLLVPPPDYRPLLAIVVWLGIALELRRGGIAAGALAAAAAGATAMIKFSMGLAGLLTVLGAAAAAWLGRRPELSLAGIAGFVAGGLLAGVAALGSPGALLDFLRISWEVSSGYGAAQVRGGPAWQPLLILAALALLVPGLSLARRSLQGIALPAAGLLLLVFKHAFVRQETHATIAFSVGGILLLWICLAEAGRGSRWAERLRVGSAALVVVGALVLSPHWNVLGLPVGAAQRIVGAIRAESELRDPAYRSRVRDHLRQALPLAQPLRGLLGQNSVDVLTVETAMVEAWELNWRPRGVLQGYAVGTVALDELDARFFAGAQAPQRLIVDLQGLDTRHPLMDAPRTWRVILSRYEPLGHDRRWTVLGLRERPRRAVERLLRRVELPLNEAVELPHPPAGHLELSVRLTPSWFGRLVAVPWKLPEIRVGLVGAELIPPRRILAATSRHPFPLTFPWAESPIGLTALFSDRPLPAPKGLALFSGGSWAWQAAELEFYEVVWEQPEDRP